MNNKIFIRLKIQLSTEFSNAESTTRRRNDHHKNQTQHIVHVSLSPSLIPFRLIYLLRSFLTHTPMGKSGEEEEISKELRLVGFSRFVRTNPRSDRFPIRSFHHVEFYCSDAATAASRFSFSLGLPISSVSNLSTGNSVHSSILISNPTSSLSFLFTAPLNSSSSASKATIPSFGSGYAYEFIARHGLAVRAVAVAVADAEAAFEVSVANGAAPAFKPTDLGCGFLMSEVKLYGDVVLRFVSRKGWEDDDDQGSVRFLPGFEDLDLPDLDYGLINLDHAVGNVEELAPVVSYMKKFLGFHEFAEFTAKDVGTAESGLNSIVLANNDENVLLPMNEPVHGMKRRSQIQTYLDYNNGPGVQHLAIRSADVIETLKKMKRVERFGGFEFMPGPPRKYYVGVKRRAGDVLSDEMIRECEELGLLVDRDDQGVLLQIFTKPIGDRPTIFIEFIQRIGCMMKDEKGKEYQKGGCGGFGKGNFSELFKCIEDYEKSIEAKQQPYVIVSSA